MVEGAAKNLIGKRLKQTGARWLVGNADAMAELVLPELQRSLGPLLGLTQLNARIRCVLFIDPGPPATYGL